MAVNCMLNYTPTSFSFDFGSIRSGSFTPSAHIFPAKDEPSVTITPDETATEISEEIYSTFLGITRCRSFSCQSDGYQLTWKISEAEHDGIRAVFIHTAITNLTDHPIYLSALSFSTGDNTIVCEGDAEDWYLGYRNTLAEKTKSSYEKIVELYTVWNFPVPPIPADPRSTDGRYRNFGEFLPLFSRKYENGLFITPVGSPAAFTNCECFVEHGGEHHGEIKITVNSEMSNVIVAPGETRWGQQIAFVYGPYEESVSAVMNHLADTHGKRTGKPPVVGWCSWYDLYSQITDNSVMSTAKAWEKLKTRRPIDVIQIDDGYQVTNGAWERNEKFPGDWSEFIKTVEDAGAMPGIWLAPVCVHNSTEIFNEHPDWFARQLNGELLGPINNWGPSAYWLDVTNPDAFEFALNTLREKRKLGFKYFKIDFNSVYADGRTSYDSSRTSLQVYRDLYKGYRDVIGEDSYLCACAGLTRGTFGFADSCRIGGDSPPVWEDYPDNCLRQCIENVADTCLSNGIIHANDPDVSFLYPKHFGERPYLTQAELQTWHTIVGILGGTQMISDAMAEERSQDNLYMIEILTPPAKEKARPLHPATDPDLRYFGMTVSRTFGDFKAEMVFNPKDTENTCIAETGEFSSIPCHVWSFWDKQYLGIRDADFPIDIAPHGCRLLRLTPAEGNSKIVLVGSDMHISMGAAEIANISCTDNSAVITLIPEAGTRDGSLYFITESKPSSVSVTGSEAYDFTWEDQLLRISLSKRDLRTAQKIIINF